MRLNDLNVLITGGGSGIGLAFASALLERGNRVMVCGRHEGKLREAQRNHPGLDVRVCDITSTGEVDALAEEIGQRYGGLNLLINNAGTQRRLNLFDGDIREAIAEELAINLTAQIQLTQRMLRLLVPQDSAIVNITSALAVVPKQSTPVYCAAKAGLHNFTRTLRYQLRTAGIRVFEVMPSLVDTGMTRGRPSRGKITPARLVKEALRGIGRDRETIYIEKTRLLMALYRISPSLAYRTLRGQ